VKLESSTDPAKKKSSKLLAKNAVPVIFSYSKPSGQEEPGVVVRVDTIVERLAELFMENDSRPDEGQYESSDPATRTADPAKKQGEPVKKASKL